MKNTTNSTAQLVIDITNDYTAEDTFLTIFIAKVKAGIAQSYNDFENAVNIIIDNEINNYINSNKLISLNVIKHHLSPNEKIIFDSNGVKIENKENIFKRFWHWIFGKKH